MKPKKGAGKGLDEVFPPPLRFRGGRVITTRTSTQRGRGRPRSKQHTPQAVDAATPYLPFRELPSGNLDSWRPTLATWWRGKTRHTDADFLQYREAVARAIEAGDVTRVAYYSHMAMLAAQALEFGELANLADVGKKKLVSDKRRGRRIQSD